MNFDDQPTEAADLLGSSPFPPIGDYAFLSDCHTGALVAPDGTVEWMCLPRFDSPSLFSAMLDRGGGGFRLAPYGLRVPAGRRYEPGTNVLETTWMTAQGWVVVRDALTVGTWHEGELEESHHSRPPTDHEADHLLVRTIECLQGAVQIEMVCEPLFDYGRRMASWSSADHPAPSAYDGSDGDTTVRVLSDLRLGVEGNRLRGRHTMEEGEKRFCVLSWTEELRGPATVEQAESSGRHRPLLARVAGHRLLPRPPLADLPSALRPDAQGAHLRPHGSAGGRRHHLAARDPRR